MKKLHRYATTLRWQGNRGSGTDRYNGYDRDYTVTAGAKPPLLFSSDPAFRGDPSRWNPEDTFLSTLSGCHMLWYLHLCAADGVIVVSYTDEAEAEMQENEDGSGQFTRVVLHPRVTVRERTMIESATALHARAHAMCFIARSVNFPVLHEPVVEVARIPEPH